jgi:hypothetical protein
MPETDSRTALIIHETLKDIVPLCYNARTSDVIVQYIILDITDSTYYGLCCFFPAVSMQYAKDLKLKMPICGDKPCFHHRSPGVGI